MPARHPVLGLILLLSACGGADGPADSGPSGVDGTSGFDPTAWSVLEEGPFGMGYLETEATYTTQLGQRRTIPVHLWYPTSEAGGGEVRYDDLFVQEGVSAGAEPAPPVHAGGHPVLVHSHGHWGVAGGVAYWARRLVSQGWVVIAPGHLGNTFTEGFPDFSGDSPTAHYIERPGDVSAALDAVVTADLLAGPLDAGAVGLSGHSRGAYTTWTAGGATFDAAALEAACAGESSDFPTRTCTSEEAAVFRSGDLADPRFAALLTLDGGIRGLFGDAGHQTVNGPVMALRKPDAGGSDQAEFDRMAGLDYTWVSVDGACHESFNLGIEASTFSPCETMERERGWSITASYATAFLRHHLRGEGGAEILGVLDGSVEIDPAASLQRR